jgi:hypothetical protein
MRIRVVTRYDEGFGQRIEVIDVSENRVDEWRGQSRRIIIGTVRQSSEVGRVGHKATVYPESSNVQVREV